MMLDQSLSDDQVLGQKIGSFRIESRLGSGSLAIVYRGVSEKTGKSAAIKVARGGRESLERRLWHSGQILNDLYHENIVRFVAMGRFHDVAYLATEFVPGITFTEVLKQRGALPWPEVARFGAEICDALDYLHHRDFLHRNLKPSHIMLTEGGHVKLIGFGLARSLETTALVKNGIAIGTPGYMAPEQICCTREFDCRTDLYALGAVLWNLLTDLSPYHDLTEFAVRRVPAGQAFVQLTQQPPRPSARIKAIPKQFDDLVVQLMDRVPENRPSDAAAVSKMLAAMVRSQ